MNPLKSNDTLKYAIELQQCLFEIEKDIDGHLLTRGDWNHILEISNWFKINQEIVLGTPLSSCLERINTVEREGGPAQGNIKLLTEAIESITKFIGTIIPKHKKKAA